MKVSLIMTVLNEGPHIRRLFDSLVQQTRLPDEIVVCDGGSTDTTLAEIESYANRLPIRIVSAPGANISKGRNVAIAAAKFDIIVATDAGVRLEPHWLDTILAGFTDGSNSSKDPAMVAGFFRPDVEGPFETAMGATVLPALEDIDPVTFVPSSRSVAFTKQAWEAVGGYPEWLGFGEDVLYDLRIRDAFGPFGWAPDAIAHFQPRTSLKAFYKQYYNYSTGDGHGSLFALRHVIRYMTYLVGLPVGLYLIFGIHWAFIFACLIVAFFYVKTPLRRLRSLGQNLTWGEYTQAILWIPIIRVVGDVAKMVAYPIGLWMRFTDPPPTYTPPTSQA